MNPQPFDREQFWRSLDEWSRQASADREQGEFAPGAGEWPIALSRRRFLQLMTASLAAAGLGGGCARQPDEPIVPYVQMPEHLVPGKPLFFATALTLGGYARGVLVESHMGRPTKIEGNPDHPASLGATDVFMQAELLSLYDPDRSRTTMHLGQIDTWSNLVTRLGQVRQQQRRTGGAGLRILTPTVTSPTLAGQLQQLLAMFPEARWRQYEPVNPDAVYEGTRLAFGRPLEVRYRFDQAEVIVSLDADFLGPGPASVRSARDFAARHGAGGPGAAMSRLYVAEPMPSTTGANADHRLALRPDQIAAVAAAIAARVGVDVASPQLPDAALQWTHAAADDLVRHRSRGVLLAGPTQPPAVHALVHRINDALGHTNTTVRYTEPIVADAASQETSIRELAEDMSRGAVDTLIMLGGNPVYDAPADLAFATQLQRVKLRIHLGLYHNETARLCHWHVPAAHELEAWSDARAFDGTASIIQPLIAPLYGGKTAHELMAVLLDQAARSSYDLVRDTWRGRGLGDDFEQGWRDVLRRGTVADTEAPPVKAALRQNMAPPATAADETTWLVLRPDPTIWDGRFNNNGWLQECPKPITTLTWDNAVLLSPALAARRGLRNGQVVRLTLGDRSTQGPVWIVPGHADQCVTVHLGYGRSVTGRTGHGAGFNAYALRTTAAAWNAAGVALQPMDRTVALAVTQQHMTIEGRDLLRVQYVGAGPHDDEHHTVHLSLYPQRAEQPGPQWGMVIDLASCIGCHACVVACQAENNIPVVGKDQVLVGREMHWIRIDRYFDGPPQGPHIHHQPVTCMHCENAPCEVVCPVNATVHSDDGLNEMVYNRCIGTRYCSNNCPYKVRRFNFLDYHNARERDSESLALMRNVDVTVRSRGVMEKCTYCVQRIRQAQIDARKDDRPIGDGEVVTACQAACPTQAITFGDINDPASAIAAKRKLPHHYGMLTELNTQPRTTYLSKLTNPHPDLDHG